MFRNKEYIYKVYKEGSFNKAAEKLHISPPALSAMIKRIETQLGMPVFNRKTTPISLTEFGIEYIKGIEAVYELEDRIHNSACELQTAQSGQLTICASNLSVDYHISKTIAEYKKAYPKVKLSVVCMNTILSKQLLDSGEVDLFITSRPLDEREYVKTKVLDEQLILVIPKSFEINKEFKHLSLTKQHLEDINNPNIKGVDLKNFKSLPFVLSNNSNYLRICADRIFDQAGFSPNIILEVEESAVASRFVKYGVGATLLASALIERDDFDNYFYIYKVNSNYCKREISAYYRTGSYVTTAMKKFLQLLQA